ncbi:carboxymuconolactone decarboxylase family protein [Mycobacterium sp. KBS0706]|jgi:AhpD family alkylhydroperoxidase|uniref:carboxymuconolactone decarboxylase family protein n=1 Tax=Mycobacterium sp. KBS0706 TaxID=2578109 RepID=UPI00110FBA88|nr:carboxymuconolactone decarboxylase family protein [Mycobacterium sp. KBS0706]TSD86989.1 carboxymuconolactone decarboxylase family protein [Mycobacterium sp. KBS0706]
MSARLNYAAAAPGAIKAQYGVHVYLEGCGLPMTLQELVFLRVSQINGCAYCLDMHAKALRKDGEGQQRLDAVAGWREAHGLFSARERAALAWAEALTLVAETRQVADAIYDEVKAQFSDRELVDLTLAIGSINSWNRLAVGFARGPEPDAESAKAAAA